MCFGGSELPLILLCSDLRFYNNKIILVLKCRLFIYSYYYGEKVFITELDFLVNFFHFSLLTCYPYSSKVNRIRIY